MNQNLTHCSCCGKKLTVIDSRRRLYGNTITVWRRRKCKPCGTKSYTAELPAEIAERVLAHLSPDPRIRGRTK